MAGPYAWTLTALFWNGAIAVHSHNLPGRIVANIFIWVIMLIGLQHIVLRNDYILGYCLSLLTLCKSDTSSVRWVRVSGVFADCVQHWLSSSSLSRSSPCSGSSPLLSSPSSSSCRSLSRGLGIPAVTVSSAVWYTPSPLTASASLCLMRRLELGKVGGEGDCNVLSGGTVVG